MENSWGIVNHVLRMYMTISETQEEKHMPTYNSPDAVESKLHRLLLTAVPENPHGNKTILYLASLMGINRWSINKWIAKDRISPERVLQVVEISKIVGFDEQGKPILGEPRVSRADFEPFVYNF